MGTTTSSETKKRPKSPPAGARAIVGVRVSAVGERDAETATSAPDQRKWGAREAELRRLEIVGLAEDLNVPGDWEHREERLGLWDAVAAIEAGEAEVLMFQNTKRFARDPELGFQVLRRIERAGGWIILGDCPDGAPKAMLGLMLGQGADDHAEKKAYFETAKETALEKGQYLARRPPVGFQWNEDAGEAYDPKRASHALAIGEAAPTVAEMFRLRPTGVSDTGLARYLEERTGISYDPRSIAAMFKNRAYVGERIYAGQVTAGAHPAIVTEEEWMAAQRKPRGVKRSGTKSLLAGIARCATCGRKLSLDRSGSTPTYRCPRDGKRPKCPAPASIRADVLDEWVWDEAVKWAKSSGLADEPIDAGLDDQLAAARALVRDAREDIEAWAVDSAGLPREAVKKGSVARLERLQEAETRVASLEDLSAAAGARVTFRELLEAEGSGVRGPLETAERRQLLDSIIARIDVRRGARFQRIPVAERATIHWIED
jgi:hypothetical protein